MGDQNPYYVLKYTPGGSPQLVEGRTGKPVERLITNLTIEVKAGKTPTAIAECLDVGFEMTLTEDQIRFKTGQMVEFGPEERVNVIAALKALKVISSGGDSRSAMLQVMAVLDIVGEKLMSGNQLEGLIARLTPVVEKVEPIPDLPPEKEAEDDFADVEAPLKEPASAPARPKPVRPGPDDEGYDPMKGMAASR